MIIQGHALTELRKMESDSIDCVVTSPPYWSLRKYDIPDVIFDGVEGCEHEWQTEIKPGLKGGRNQGRGKPDDKNGMTYTPVPDSEYQFCSKCGAWRGQLGLEPTIDLYLKHLLEIFDEVKRVLKPTGSCWVNLGDSYHGGKGMSSQAWSTGHQDRQTLQKSQHQLCGMNEARPNDLPQGNIQPKSLILIPYRFAIALIDRGWICRNIIEWWKRNCMPSSVKDRFTVDFEPVFFFVKSRKYWFEQQYEPHLDFDKVQKEIERQHRRRENNEDLKIGDNWVNHSTKWGGNKDANPQGRNKRCVWDCPTQPYPESHFATFPEDLVEPMIKAGCPKEICVKCGKAREKIVEVTREYQKSIRNDCKEQTFRHFDGQRWDSKYQDKGYTDCGCNAGFRPGIVLDPFCGSGTVLKVAEKLQRQAIGIDLGYEELAIKRKQWNQIELMP